LYRNGNMDDLSRFLDFLFEETEGYVYVATKDTQAVNQSWEQKFFEWPTGKSKVYDYVTRNQEKLDVYVAPALYKSDRNALKQNVQGSSVVWVEFDGQQVIDFQDLPEPDCIVQTSSDTHMHCYWKVPYFTDVERLESVNRRLMFYLEADASGYDATQVLRPPLSKNWKHNGVPVTLKTLIDTPIPKLIDVFDVAPVVERETIKLNSQMLLDPGELLKNLPLHVHTKKRVMSETPDYGSRSSFLTKTAHELAEQGCNHLQIVTLLSFADDRVGKFKGRKDKLTRLSELASLALLAHQVEEEIRLYSPLQIINHKENLEWLIPGWLHTKGFMIITGPPAVGKTQLAIQLTYHLTTQPEFLGKSISKNDLKILILSLEMSSIELQYIFQHLNQKFEGDVDWDSRVRILDEEKTLIEYEEIIADYGPDIVILDSLTELASEELKESEARAITRWIKKCRRKYNTAWICIHHNRKDTTKKKFRETGLGDVYGSYIFGKDSETVLNQERDFEDETIITIYSLKLRYDRKFVADLVQDTSTLYYSLKGPTDVGESGLTIKPGSINLDL
jgi:hypothetical protein